MTPLMLTTNLWEYDDFSSADKDWIEANCVAVHISAPVWEAAPSGSSGATLPTGEASPRRRKRTR